MNRRKFLAALTAGTSSLCSTLSVAQTAGARKHALSGMDIHGKSIDLQSMTAEAYLVTFFTSACNLCKVDMQLVRDFYAANKHRRFAILGVNMDKNIADFTQYMRLVELSLPPERQFPVLWRPAPKHQDTFGKIMTNPTHFVLNRHRDLVIKREGPLQSDDWDDLWLSLQ